MDKRELSAISGAKDALYIAHEDKRLLLLVYPYAPFAPFPKGYLYLDAYYPASNYAYNKAKELCSWIKAQGKEAEIFEDIPLKKAGALSKALAFGQNRLLSHETFGSYIVLQCIKTDYAFDLPLLNFDQEAPLQINPVCASCQLCVKACPNKALNAGFIRSRCLRDIMNKTQNARTITLLGDCVLGCTICRQACPLNAKVKPVQAPQELIELLSFEKLLEFSKDTKTKLAQFIGTNMARRSLLLPTVIAAVLKNREERFYPALNALQTDPSVRVSTAATAAMQVINRQN